MRFYSFYTANNEPQATPLAYSIRMKKIYLTPVIYKKFDT